MNLKLSIEHLLSKREEMWSQIEKMEDQGVTIPRELRFNLGSISAQLEMLRGAENTKTPQ